MGLVASSEISIAPTSAALYNAGNEQLTAPSLIRSLHSFSPETTDKDNYRLGSDVLLLIVHDGTARILDLGGNVCAISETGTMMLESVLRDGVDRASMTLAAYFGTAVERIRHDTDLLLHDLVRQGLLVAPGIRQPDRSLRARCSAFIAPIVAMCVRSPIRSLRVKASLLLGLSYISNRMLGWAITVEIWKRVTSLVSAKKELREAETLDTIDAVVAEAMAVFPLNVGCKERALCCWALTRAAGIPARIVLGIDLFPFALHCWCEYGSRVLADRSEGRCDRYTPIMAYQ